MSDTQKEIKEIVENNPIVIFMKGSPQAPQCGFSAQTVDCLQKSGVNNAIAVDVLSHPEIRQGIKEFTNWPTIPQVFIKGEFVGGCDIVTELFERGELSEMVKSAQE